MFDYRFGKNPKAEWSSVFNALEKISFDKSEYAKNYIGFIKNNSKDIIDKMIENAPDWEHNRKDIEKAAKKLIKNKQISKEAKEKEYMENILLASMRLKGVE